MSRWYSSGLSEDVMRLIRNLAFVLLVVAMICAGRARLRADYYFCPDGCDCHESTGLWGRMWTVDCSQTECLNWNSFCDDAYNSCVEGGGYCPGMLGYARWDCYSNCVSTCECDDVPS